MKEEKVFISNKYLIYQILYYFIERLVMELTRRGTMGFRISYSFIPERTPIEFVDNLERWKKG